MLKHVLRAELLLVLANDPDVRVRTALIKVELVASTCILMKNERNVSSGCRGVFLFLQVVQTYLQRASDEEVNRFIKQKYFMHLGNQIALYPGSEQLVVALENLVLRGPTLAAMPPLMAMIAKAEGTDANIARPIISFITDIIAKVRDARRLDRSTPRDLTIPSFPNYHFRTRTH